MTCIVGIETPEGVFMGADSAAITGWTIDRMVHGKMFRKGEFTVACTGTVRTAQLVQYALNVTPPPLAAGRVPDDLHAYMVTEFSPALRECLLSHGALKKENEVVELDSEFLVGIRRQLFCIDSAFGVHRSERGYAADGCGKRYALGALHVLDSDHWREAKPSPTARCLMALAAAAEHDIGVSPPFTVYAP